MHWISHQMTDCQFRFNKVMGHTGKCIIANIKYVIGNRKPELAMAGLEAS